MSQAASQPATISSAFLRVPVNPNATPVKSTESTPPKTVVTTETQPLVPPAPSQPSLAPQPVQVVQPTSLSATPAPQPVQVVQPTSLSATPAPQPPAPQPEVQPAVPQQLYPNTPPPVDPYLYQRMAEERNQLIAENKALHDAVGNLTKSAQDYELLRRQQELQQSIANETFEGLETVDPKDAKQISEAVLRVAAEPLNALRRDMETQRQEMYQAAQQQAQQAQQFRYQQLTQEVLRHHPDFYVLQNSPAYQQFMSARDGLSSKSRDQRAAEELMAGNTAYVVDLLNQLKGVTPQVQNVTTVAPVQVASAAAPAAEATPTPTYTLRELNDLMQMRRISHDEYRKRLAELRAATPGGF